MGTDWACLHHSIRGSRQNHRPSGTREQAECIPAGQAVGRPRKWGDRPSAGATSKSVEVSLRGQLGPGWETGRGQQA